MGAFAVGGNDSVFVFAVAAATAVAETVSSKIGGGSSRLSVSEIREVSLAVNHEQNSLVDPDYWEDASSSGELRADSPYWERFPEN